MPSAVPISLLLLPSAMSLRTSISREVNSFRIITKVYSLKGEFVFKGLAPGKYYLETEVGFSSGIGGAEISGIAEIKTDGEIVSVTLK